MAQLDAQTALVRKFFERRNLDLIRSVRETRADIAERISTTGGTLRPFVDAVTTAFDAFARGLIADTLDLMRRSGLAIDHEFASWIQHQLEPLIDGTAERLIGEVDPDLRVSVQNRLNQLAAAIRRDLRIELDLALLEKPAEPSAVVDGALLDPLVPLQNRRGLEQEFGTRTKESTDPICLVLFDVDHFKDVNDKHGGHATGDEALISIAEAAGACIKGKGSAFRYGGDEFVLLLPNHNRQEGLAVAERFRREVNGKPRTAQQLTLSVSVGVAVGPDDGGDFSALHKAADAALYDAKKHGRNIVRYFGEPDPPTPAPREPERKAPEPGGLSAEEQKAIRQDYFRHHVARCPKDDAVLEVVDMTSLGEVAKRLLVSCPLCGLQGSA
jgi:diguanylate cyclase (GGDEF)-like protein